MCIKVAELGNESLILFLKYPLPKHPEAVSMLNSHLPFCPQA